MQTTWRFCALGLVFAAACDRPGSLAATSAEPLAKMEVPSAAGSNADPVDPPGATAGVACFANNDLATTFSRLFDAADVNGDGLISKPEAYAAAAFLLGGAFVEADANGDGVVTPEEGRQARHQFMQQHPQVAALFHEVRNATGQSAFVTLSQITAVDMNRPLRLQEVRKATQGAVDAVFTATDTNHDGNISRDEARAAGVQAARFAGAAAFGSADKDHDGKVSWDEFQQAMTPVAKAAFDLADTNKDGTLSQAEAGNAASQVADRMGI